MVERPPYKIRKIKSGIWFEVGFPWTFRCRKCDRFTHHWSWRNALTHSAMHICRPGSIW